MVAQVLLSLGVLLPRLVQLVAVPAPPAPRHDDALAHLPVPRRSANRASPV